MHPLSSCFISAAFIFVAIAAQNITTTIPSEETDPPKKPGDNDDFEMGGTMVGLTAGVAVLIIGSVVAFLVYQKLSPKVANSSKSRYQNVDGKSAMVLVEMNARGEIAPSVAEEWTSEVYFENNFMVAAEFGANPDKEDYMVIDLVAGAPISTPKARMAPTIPIGAINHQELNYRLKKSESLKVMIEELNGPEAEVVPTSVTFQPKFLQAETTETTDTDEIAPLTIYSRKFSSIPSLRRLSTSVSANSIKAFADLDVLVQKISTPSTPSSIISNLVILRKISETACSSTFECEIKDKTSLRGSIWKKLPPNSVVRTFLTSIHSKSHFENVLSIVTRLQVSPHCVQLYASQADATFVYITKHYPTTLKEFINNPLLQTFNIIKSLCSQLLKAIADFHDLGIAHINLSPESLYVELTDDVPRLIIGDFGMSHLLGGVNNLEPAPSSAIDRRRSSGTPFPCSVSSPSRSKVVNSTNYQFSPPESFSTYSISALNHNQLLQKVDVYAAAMLLLFLVNGENPWKDLSMEEVEIAVTAGQRPDLGNKADFDPLFLSEINNLVQRGSDTDPLRRPATSFMSIQLENSIRQ